MEQNNRKFFYNLATYVAYATLHVSNKSNHIHQEKEPVLIRGFYAKKIFKYRISGKCLNDASSL